MPNQRNVLRGRSTPRPKPRRKQLTLLLGLVGISLGACQTPPPPPAIQDRACLGFRPYSLRTDALPVEHRVWVAGHNAFGASYCPNWGSTSNTIARHDRNK